MALPIVLSGLTATPGVNHVKWAWIIVDPNKNGLPYLEAEATEVWVAQSNERALAFKVGEGVIDFVQTAVPGQTFFGWIKARSRDGEYTEFFPLGSSSGVEVSVTAGSGGGGGDDEQTQDVVAAMIQNGTGITWLYDDDAGTLTPTIAVGWTDIADKPATFPPEAHSHAISDVTGLVTALDAKLDVGGDTMTGPLTLNGAPTVDLHAATKKYVDDAITAGGGYTNEDAQDAAAAMIQNGTGISWAYNDTLNTLTPTVTLAPFSTTNLAEGTNLYYTDARADARVAAGITGKQNLDADLTSIAGYASTGKWLYRSAADTWSEVTIGTGLSFTGGTLTCTVSGSGTPGGSNTQIQFNSSGAFGASANLTWVSPVLTVGLVGTARGQIVLASTANASVTLQAATGTSGNVTLTFPLGAGTTGQPLLSGGGAGGAMSFGTLSADAGGTGAAGTLTGVAIGRGSTAMTSTQSSTVGQVLRCTGGNTYAFGALDLADADAVTGQLPFANVAGAQASDADLTSIANYAGTSKWLYRSATDTWSEVTVGTGLSFSGGTLTCTVSTSGFLPVNGSVPMTGDLTISKVNPFLILNKAAELQGNTIQGSTAGEARWQIILGDVTDEGPEGSQAGSDFRLARFNDDGLTSFPVLVVTRATGAASFSSTVSASAPTAPAHLTTKTYVETYVGDQIAAVPVYTNEEAQDAIGSILVNSGSITFTYNDATPSITAVVTAVDWSIITSKPSTFPPATHSHAISDVTGLQTALDGKLGNSGAQGLTGSLDVVGAVIADYVGLDDTDATHQLNLFCGDNLTGNSSITFRTGDASARSLTLNANLTVNENVTISNWFNQDVRTTATPTFAVGSATGNPVTVGGTQTLTNKTLTTPVIASIRNTGGVDIEGSNTNDAAAAGDVGEHLQDEKLAGAAIALTHATTSSVCSIPLTAGDYDVWGVLYVTPSGAPMTSFIAAIHTSAALPVPPNGGARTQIQFSMGAGLIQGLFAGQRRYTVAAGGQTVHLVINCNFTGGTATAYGGIYARRVR